MGINEIIKEAMSIVTPSIEEESKIFNIANMVVNTLRDGLARRGYYDFDVTIQGSVAKGTWLPGDRDIDIFIILPRGYVDKVRSGNVINDLIDVAIDKGFRWNIRYAQHPYIQLLIDSFEIDVVPCIRINPGEKPFTAADRTPLHTDFVKSRLGQRNTEVRLLKAFFKAIGVYGAEIRVQGFSGYVSELLVIHYGSFTDTVKAMSRWSVKRVFIDMTGTYNERDAIRKFKSPVIIIDPVDPNRNAAASISRETLAMAIAAAKEFIKNPRIDFFLSNHARPKPLRVLPTVILRIPYPNGTSPDVVWGEAKRLMATLIKNLRELDFRIIRSMSWSDDKSIVLLMLTLEQLELPSYELHKGPYVDSEAVDNFVSKYVNDPSVIGPFIRGSRWYVIRSRKMLNAIDAIKHIIPMVSLKNLKDSISRVEYMTIKSLDDLTTLSPNERGVVEEFIYARPWWLT